MSWNPLSDQLPSRLRMRKSFLEYCAVCISSFMVDVRALDSYTCIEENTCFKNKGQLHSTLQFT